jgi:hypothetical protein
MLGRACQQNRGIVHTCLAKLAPLLLCVSMVAAGSPGCGTTAATDVGAHDAASDRDAAATARDAGPPEPICDGSETMRLWMTGDNWSVDPGHGFKSPYGSVFVLVDGKCRFYGGTHGSLEIRTGTLTATQAEELSAAIGYSSIEAWSKTPPVNTCSDGGGAALVRPGFTASCICDCNPADGPAGKNAAIRQISKWATALEQQGTPISGDVSAVAQARTSDAPQTTVAWPLSRPMSTIDGLIQAGPYAPAGARFTDEKECAALRALRAQPRQTSLTVTDAGMTYDLIIRDELPTAVASELTALRAAP